MDIPKMAINKEYENLYHIYLFCIQNKWWAFGYSAFYLSFIYPDLINTKKAFMDQDKKVPCIIIPDAYLLELSDNYDTFASDEYIQISVPPTVYCYRKTYDDWCNTLAMN